MNIVYNNKKSTMRRHSSQDYESIGNDFGYLSHKLSGECWQKRMLFILQVDGDEINSKVDKPFKFNVFEAKDSDGHLAVVLMPNEFLPELRMATYSFTDATYQTVPLISTASQLLTFLVEMKEKVCICCQKVTFPKKKTFNFIIKKFFL